MSSFAGSIKRRWITAMAVILALLFLAAAFVSAFVLTSNARFSACAATGCAPALLIGLTGLSWLLTLPLIASAIVFSATGIDAAIRHLRNASPTPSDAPVLTENAGTTGLSQVVRKLTAELAQERQARIEADARAEYALSHDALTGLVNRTRMTQLITDAIERVQSNKQVHNSEGLAVFFLDFDDFKYLNDTYGHTAGDQFLRLMGDRLRRALDCDDCVARIGGDEFLVLSEQVATTEDAGVIAEALLKEVARPCLINGTDVRVTTSIGVALCPAHVDNTQQLINSADRAMYQAKQRGRNTFCIAADANIK
jgi:diguanylate cyclase (GGDEF)-like protein